MGIYYYYFRYHYIIHVSFFLCLLYILHYTYQ